MNISLVCPLFACVECLSHIATKEDNLEQLMGTENVNDKKPRGRSPI